MRKCYYPIGETALRNYFQRIQRVWAHPITHAKHYTLYTVMAEDNPEDYEECLEVVPHNELDPPWRVRHDAGMALAWLLEEDGHSFLLAAWFVMESLGNRCWRGHRYGSQKLFGSVVSLPFTPDGDERDEAVQDWLRRELVRLG